MTCMRGADVVGSCMRSVVVLLVLSASTARAQCARPDPTIFCGLSSTAVVGTVPSGAAGADGDVVIVVRRLAGRPMAGVELGAQLTLRGLATDVAVTPSTAEGASNLFILRNVETYLLGAPIVDGRVAIDDDDDTYGIAVDEALLLATDTDEAACDERATRVVDPSIYLGQCTDDVDNGGGGCATTSSSGLSALTLLAAAVCWRRRPATRARSPR